MLGAYKKGRQANTQVILEEKDNLGKKGSSGTNKKTSGKEVTPRPKDQKGS